MADNKNQHYVPRCYLKPFSLNREGKAINLYNISNDRLIQNASVRGQCSKDYFYGEDLAYERNLQKVEGRYSAIVRKVGDASANLTEDDMSFLRDFSYLQFSRTETAIIRTRLAMMKMEAAAFEGSEHLMPDPDYGDRRLMRQAMRRFEETVHHLDDLKTCLIHNLTQIPFVTSDDPAVLTNRLYAQRVGRRYGGAGITNAGVMMFLPLTPSFAAVTYDGDVYTAAGKKGSTVDATRGSDILGINELQYLKSSENIYFHDWGMAAAVQKEFKSVEARRLKAWHEVSVAVLDQEGDGWSRYRVAHSREERVGSQESIIRLSAKFPIPSKWCSNLRFRSKPRFIDTKSGAGLQRRPRH
ncbi:MAG: DUF4238 domain-containing protein [Alphaproteobacteria bacterium]|nr:DUF4238 domain-containing protein [Alphaproteobacteria bacterium]